MPYQPYFSLSVRHHYYQQQVCPAIALSATQLCQAQCRRQRLLIKSGTDRLQVVIATDDQREPLIPSSETAIFTFLLTLKDSEFIRFTQLDADYQPGQSFYVFSHHELAASDDLTLRSQVLQFSDLASAQSSPSLARYAALTELQTPQRSRIFGIVEIQPRQYFKQVPEQALEFTIPFVARSRSWSYYLVTDRTVTAEAFSIRDQGAERGTQKLHFSRVEQAAGDRIIASIQQQFPDSQTVIFQSDAPVPCQDTGRANLQLMKQGHSTAWIHHLPNPPDDHGVQVINLLTDV